MNKRNVLNSLCVLLLFSWMGSVIACQSSGGIVENSLGYRVGGTFPEGADVEPPWTKGVTRQGNLDGKSGTFFIGEARQKSGIDEASAAAEGNVSNQISKTIGVDVKISVDEFESETARNVFVESWQRSAASFSGAQKTQYYWEKIQEKKQFTINYWVEYFISDIDLESAKKKYETRQDILAMERQIFNAEKKRFEEIKPRLDNRQNTDADYSNLLESKSKLQGLKKLEEDPDDAPSLKELLGAIQAALSANDPLKQVELLNSRVKYLEGQLEYAAQNRQAILDGQEKKDQAILDSLENVENSVRNIPRGTQVPLVVIASVLHENLHIAENMTTNADFLAYLIQRNGSTRQFDNTDPQDMKKPVTNIAFTQAALYCNWLSECSGFAPYYDIDGYLESIKVPNQNVNGYRLPTERELSDAIAVGVIKSQEAGVSRLWFDDGDEDDRGALFDLGTSRSLNTSRPDLKTGFIVVKNAQ